MDRTVGIASAEFDDWMATPLPMVDAVAGGATEGDANWAVETPSLGWLGTLGVNTALDAPFAGFSVSVSLKPSGAGLIPIGKEGGTSFVGKLPAAISRKNVSELTPLGA
jgi:hypothetical protein